MFIIVIKNIITKNQKAGCVRRIPVTDKAQEKRNNNFVVCCFLN